MPREAENINHLSLNAYKIDKKVKKLNEMLE